MKKNKEKSKYTSVQFTRNFYGKLKKAKKEHHIDSIENTIKYLIKNKVKFEVD